MTALDKTKIEPVIALKNRSNKQKEEGLVDLFVDDMTKSLETKRDKPKEVLVDFVLD